MPGAIPHGGFVRIKGQPEDPDNIFGYGPGYWTERFELDKARIVREFEARLLYLRDHEARVRGETMITNTDIINIMRQIARWSGVPKRKRILSNVAIELTENFTQIQKVSVYRWLNEISESTSRRWRSFHHSFSD